MIQDLEYNGTWRVYWGKEDTNWIEMHPYGGYSWDQSKLLQAGIETSGSTEPSNAMTQEVAGVWGSPPSWHPWEAAYRKAQYVFIPSEVPICDQPLAGLTPGDASFETSNVPPC